MTKLKQLRTNSRRELRASPAVVGPRSAPDREADILNSIVAKEALVPAEIAVTNLASPKLSAISATALAAFFSASERWGLTNDEQVILLGIDDRSQYVKWQRNPAAAALSRDTLERISILITIYNDLHRIFPEDYVADNWLRDTVCTAILADGSLLDRMLAGHFVDLVIVRQFLNHLLSGWK